MNGGRGLVGDFEEVAQTSRIISGGVLRFSYFRRVGWEGGP